MKRLLTLCLISMTAIHAQAQKTIDRTNAKTALARQAQAILAQQLQSGLAMKITATTKRLTGVSRYEAGVLTDSMRHRYRSGKGSSHPTENSYFSNSENSQQYFKADDPRAIQYIQSDTSITYWRPVASLIERGKVVNDYDASGNLTYSLHEDDGNTYEHFITNNGNGQRATVTLRDSVSGNGQPYADKVKHYFVYDTQNRIVLDSAIFIPLNITAYKASYHYDGGGNLDTMTAYEVITSTLEPTFMTVFTYDASNRLASATLWEDNSSGWELDHRTVYGYTGAAAQSTTLTVQLWDSFNSQWQDDNGEIIELNSADKMVRKYSLTASASHLDTNYRTDYTYNADGLFQEISNAVYLGNGNFSAPDVFLHFYYEDYFPAGITEAGTASKTFGIYPVPAANSLHLSKAITPQTKAAIIDINGRTVMQITPRAAYQPIDVSEIKPGTYLLRLDQSLQRFIIIR